jgi:hypothetical protein
MWHVCGEKRCRMGLMEKCEGERPYRGPRHRRDYNIKMVLMEIDWEGLDLIAVAQDRDNWWAVVNLVMNPQGPKNERDWCIAENLTVAQEQLCCMQLISWSY